MFCYTGVDSEHKKTEKDCHPCSKWKGFKLNIQAELNGYRPSKVEALMFAFVSHTHFMVRRSAKNHQLSQNFYQLKFEIPQEVGTCAPSGYSF